MAGAQLLSLACLAFLASSALAAPACVYDAVIQSATLTGSTPKGCLTDELVQKTAGLSSSCFNTVTLYRQAGAGCNGFGVGLLDGKNQTCFEGPVGNGTLTPAKGGGYTAKGAFVGGAGDFTGTQSADNKTFTVSVKQFNCELAYALKAANATTANGTATNITAAALPGTTARSAGTPSAAASPPPAPTKSGVAATLPSAAVLVLGAVMAFAF